ncbi:hypothetical protein B0H14DRAFT_2600671 [Mycena olivaceomarginata]|nr:hypothetical protein B0H14DRAFT_2600671 [Mycena olivaceomarginata]
MPLLTSAPLFNNSYCLVNFLPLLEHESPAILCRIARPVPFSKRQFPKRKPKGEKLPTAMVSRMPNKCPPSRSPRRPSPTFNRPPRLSGTPMGRSSSAACSVLGRRLPPPPQGVQPSSSKRKRQVFRRTVFEPSTSLIVHEGLTHVQNRPHRRSGASVGTARGPFVAMSCPVVSAYSPTLTTSESTSKLGRVYSIPGELIGEAPVVGLLYFPLLAFCCFNARLAHRSPCCAPRLSFIPRLAWRVAVIRVDY